MRITAKSNWRLMIDDCPLRRGGPFVLAVSLVACAALASTTRADIIITFEATNVDGEPIGETVPAQSMVLVDILLSVDEADDPLLDLRTIQLDFEATTVTLVLDAFLWELPVGVEDDSYSSFEGLPRPRLVYLSNTRVGNSIIDLDQSPLRVATVEVRVNSSGTLDLRNVGGDQAEEELLLRAGFEDPVDYTLDARNVTGGTLRLTVEGATGPDSDRDGVPDLADDFPFDPTETVDSDDDGVGDNSDDDDDGDGVDDDRDQFPDDPDEAFDTDGDGDGNNADTDDDNDGVLDAADAFPLDPRETRDSDSDGVGDNADPDSPDDRNTGPRATGGICGGSVGAAMLWILAGLQLTTRFRPRRPGRSRHVRVGP